MSKQKNYLVLWSGGLDSTCLVWKLLSDGHQVSTCYINLKNNLDKSKREIKARKLMVPFFRQQFKNNFHDCGVTAEILVLNGSEGFSDLKQVAAWICGIMYSLKNENEDKLNLGHNVFFDYVALGYVLNDCAISYLNDIRKIYYSYQGLNSKGCKLPKIIFPLIKTNKEDMAKEIPEDLIKHVTFCEFNNLDNNKPCGLCSACQTWKNKKLDNYIDKKYKRFLEDEDKAKICKKGLLDDWIQKPAKKKRKTKIKRFKGLSEDLAMIA